MTSSNARPPERTARSRRALRALIVTILVAIAFLIVSVIVITTAEDSLPLWLGPYWFAVLVLVLFAIPGLLIAIITVWLWPNLVARKPVAVAVLVLTAIAVLVLFGFIVVSLGSQLG
jgi:uncharacterized integral membrane protein